MHAQDWLLAFLAIIFPPIPVIVKRGLCSAECKLNNKKQTNNSLLQPYTALPLSFRLFSFPFFFCSFFSPSLVISMLTLIVFNLIVVISILLLILGVLPSLIYGWYIISKYPKHEYINLSDSEAQYGSV